jgi:hypothetical protein
LAEAPTHPRTARQITKWLELRGGQSQTPAWSPAFIEAAEKNEIEIWMAHIKIEH